MGPQAFVVAGARGGIPLEHILPPVTTFLGPVCAGCRACEAICPQEIPILGLAAALRDQHRVVVAARNADGGGYDES
jgi:ferredoxin